MDMVTSVENRKIVQREKRKSNSVYGMYVLIIANARTKNDLYQVAHTLTKWFEL